MASWTAPVAGLRRVWRLPAANRAGAIVGRRPTVAGAGWQPLGALPRMPSGSDDSVAFKILAKFDIFTIWQIALVALGLAIVYKFTVKKSASMVIGFWGLWIIISVGLSTLFKGRFMM